MRRLILLAPLALAACDVHTNDRKDGKDVHIGLGSGDAGNNSVSIDAPGFSGSVKLPSLNIGAHMDLDGLKLAPDSHVKGMDVLGGDKDAGGEDHGRVQLDFTNPGAPAAMMAYYRDALVHAGYTLGGQRGDNDLRAAKDGKSFDLQLAPDGGGSRGRITIGGRG